ncbi:MAG: hypothetical protein M3135_01855 [Actinomycetota bacterium]|nr:hypothetical protein [Actinomycetota bacterium]
MASLRVVQRSSRAFRGRGAILSYCLAIAGVLGFGIGADYLQSERTDTIAVAKSCAEARTSGAVNLPSICGAPKEEMGGEDQAEESIEQEIAERSRDCQPAWWPARR